MTSDTPNFDDPRISFDKAKQNWVLEGDDGSEMEWDVKFQRFVSVADLDQLSAQQAAYGVSGVDESTPADVVARRHEKKRKDFTSNKSNDSNAKRDKPPPPKTAVFVTGLPPDVTVDEIADVFSKYGVLLTNDDGSPKVKLYTDDLGNFKGEALVVYYKQDSVSLAVQLLDDTELRYGDGSAIRVSVADFKPEASDHTNSKHTTQKPAKPLTEDEKRRKQTKFRKLDEKLNDWDSEDESGLADRLPSNTTSRVVVLRHMFTPSELKEDPTLLLDLKQDVREDAEQIGKVTSVVLYDAEPDGIMTVKFSDHIAAQACVLKYEGRYFAGRRVVSYLYDGKETFKTTESTNKYTETAEQDEQHRLNDFVMMESMDADETSLFPSEDELEMESIEMAVLPQPTAQAPSAPSPLTSTRPVQPGGVIYQQKSSDKLRGLFHTGSTPTSTAIRKKSEKRLLSIDNNSNKKFKRKRRDGFSGGFSATSGTSANSPTSINTSDDFVTRSRKSLRESPSPSPSPSQLSKRSRTQPRETENKSDNTRPLIHAMHASERKNLATPVHPINPINPTMSSADSSHESLLPKKSPLPPIKKGSLPSFRGVRDFRPDTANNHSTPQKVSKSEQEKEREKEKPKLINNMRQTEAKLQKSQRRPQPKSKPQLQPHPQPHNVDEEIKMSRDFTRDLGRNLSRNLSKTLSRDLGKNLNSNIIELSSDSENEVEATTKAIPSSSSSCSPPTSIPERSSTGHRKKTRKYSPPETKPVLPPNYMEKPMLEECMQSMQGTNNRKTCDSIHANTNTNTLQNGRNRICKDIKPFKQFKQPFNERMITDRVNDETIEAMLQITEDEHSFHDPNASFEQRKRAQLVTLERESRVNTTQVIEGPAKKPATIEQIIKPVFINMPREQREAYKRYDDKQYSQEETDKASELEAWKLAEKPDKFVGLKFVGSLRRHPRTGEVLNSKSLEHTFLAHIEQAETLMDNRNTFSIRNDVDSDPCPPVEFIYNNKPCYGSGVPKNNEKGQRRCGCNGKCDPSTCECFQRQKYIFEGFCDRYCAYDDDGLLNTRDLPIFECNELCGCDDSCQNKVTSKPTNFNLEIFKKEKMGWGVRTRRKIQKGQFIAVYSGEYITNDMAIHRSDIYDKVNRKYDFDIDFYHLRNKKMYAKATQCNKKRFEKLSEDSGDVLGNTSTGTANEAGRPLQSLISPQKELQQYRDIDFDLQSYYTIDAFFIGNFTRFINHCCKPNLIVQPVYTVQTSVDLPFLGFYALRDIRENEELSISYMGVDSDEEDVEQALSRKKKKTKIRSKKAKRVLDDDDSILEEAVPECFCGAPNCRAAGGCSGATVTVSMTSINPRKLTDWHLRFAEIAHGLVNEHTDTFKDTEKDTTSDSTTERRLRTASKQPPVKKPEIIAFQLSSFCLTPLTAQSNDENIPPHTPKLPPSTGALALIAAKLPGNLSPRGLFLAPFIPCQIEPPTAPIANAPPKSLRITYGHGSLE
ncbi:hypothetical protein E3P98_00524 [Wallemia ichthyophaga]|nr:hypothetical protein E3P98_00524 [Wallemia ichthyophaga]